LQIRFFLNLEKSPSATTVNGAWSSCNREKERSANGEKHTGKCAVLKSEECVTVEHYREQLDHYVDLREHMSSGSIPEDHLPLMDKRENNAYKASMDPRRLNLTTNSKLPEFPNFIKCFLIGG
jgi:hypothetical protein